MEVIFFMFMQIIAFKIDDGLMNSLSSLERYISAIPSYNHVQSMLNVFFCVVVKPTVVVIFIMCEQNTKKS